MAMLLKPYGLLAPVCRYAIGAAGLPLVGTANWRKI
jgi:hypothetical protein